MFLFFTFIYIFALYKAHFKFSSERSFEGTNLASGTLSLSFGLHNVETNVFFFVAAALFVWLFFLFWSAEHCNQHIQCFNVLISIEIDYVLFELLYDTVIIEISAFIETKVKTV